MQIGNPDKGMQAWDKLLDDKQILQLYDYVRRRADKVLPPGRPDEVGPNGGLWVPACWVVSHQVRENNLVRLFLYQPCDGG